MTVFILRRILLTIPTLLLVSVVCFAVIQLQPGSFTDRYLVWAVGVGIRLFLVYLIIGIGVSVAEGWAEYIATIGALDYFAAFRVVVGALVFALVAVIIPNRTARYLLDGTSFGLSDAVRMK